MPFSLYCIFLSISSTTNAPQRPSSRPLSLDKNPKLVRNTYAQNDALTYYRLTRAGWPLSCCVTPRAGFGSHPYYPPPPPTLPSLKYPKATDQNRTKNTQIAIDLYIRLLLHTHMMATHSRQPLSSRNTFGRNILANHWPVRFRRSSSKQKKSPQQQPYNPPPPIPLISGSYCNQCAYHSTSYKRTSPTQTL